LTPGSQIWTTNTNAKPIQEKKLSENAGQDNGSLTGSHSKKMYSADYCGSFSLAEKTSV
jgi:hypothetical protein